MKMTCQWMKDDYFALLMCKDKKAYAALEMLVDDLHTEKDPTIAAFLGHSGSEDFLWGLVNLLGCDNPRVAGNSAYIIGTLAESDMGCHRVLGLAKSHHKESKKILPDLTRMLTFDDAESVMNAAGTMGTLAESYEGREWMLTEDCLDETIQHVTTLLHADNLWTASNAALVLARLSISEDGCQRILSHDHSHHILSQLVQSLGVDEAGRGMNAAFAIGRLCDIDIGRKRLLMLNESERMLSALAKMLSCDDTGSSKNACFALSCLATNAEGHSRILNNLHSDDILRTLAELLTAEDSETGWFAAMTMRTLASQPRGCLRLRDHGQIVPALKAVEKNDNANEDLKEEVVITLQILKKLEKPSPPEIEVLGSDKIKASWPAVVTKSGMQVRYQLFDNTKCVYVGTDLFCEVEGLQPCTQYNYKLRAFTEGDESPFSETVVAVTEESVPGAPQNLRVLACTITQLKVGWEPPESVHGILKGYTVYLGDKYVEHTTDTVCIISGLVASTSYEIEVCAATSKGKGERACCIGTTAELGAHAPSKPHVQVIGRNEIHISWNPPEVPLGRITRYDLIMNTRTIYSGTELSFTALRLTPDTEYGFVVVALTNEGKFESKITKKKTSKDEYDSNRPPLYQTPAPRRESIQEEKLQTAAQKKKKTSIAGVEPKARATSAKKSHTSAEKRNKTPSEPKNDNSTRPSSEPIHVLKLTQKASSSISSGHNQEPKQVTEEVESPPKELSSPPFKAVPEVKKDLQSVLKKPSNPLPIKEAFPTSKPVHQKSERSNINNKMFPVSMSFVSIQGENAVKPENSQPEVRKAFGRTGTFVDNHPGMHQGFKIERSRTILAGSNKKDLKTRNLKDAKMDFAINNNSSNGNTQSKLGQEVDLSPSTISLDKPTTLKTKNTVKPILNDLQKTPFRNSYGNDTWANPLEKDEMRQLSSKSGKRVTYSDLPSDKDNDDQPNKSAGKRVSYADNRSYSADTAQAREQKKKGPRESVLPKPELPSQQYLESGGTQSSNMPWGSRSLPSPRSSQDFTNKVDSSDTDWLMRSLLDQASSKSIHGNYLSPSGHPNDCSYFLDMQQAFVQRANTYINSHRSATTVDSSKVRNRPTGKKSLDKLTKSPGNSTVVSNMFSPELPDNKATMAQWNTKFIPMQLRTQPSNLPPSQLQRVNTTLLNESAKGVQFRRVEALARSQTLMEMRNSSGVPTTPSMTLGEQAELFPVQNPGVQRSSSKERSSTAGKSSRSQARLMKTPSSRHKEPDSMLLRQSWSKGTSNEAALQSAR